MKAIDSVIGVGWIVFWAYWLVMAATAKQSRWTKFAGVRVGIILVILLLIRLRVFKGHGAPHPNAWQRVCYPLMRGLLLSRQPAAGMAIRARAPAAAADWT